MSILLETEHSLGGEGVVIVEIIPLFFMYVVFTIFQIHGKRRKEASQIMKTFIY